MKAITFRCTNAELMVLGDYLRERYSPGNDPGPFRMTLCMGEVDQRLRQFLPHWSKRSYALPFFSDAMRTVLAELGYVLPLGTGPYSKHWLEYCDPGEFTQ